MEALFFFAGVATVSVLLTLGWVLKVVTVQVKQFRNLENVVESVTRDIITENDVRGIVDSRVDKHADYVSREFEKIERELIAYTDGLNNNSMDNINQIHHRIDDVQRELMDQININRVTNTRNVTNGDLLTEY